MIPIGSCPLSRRLSAKDNIGDVNSVKNTELGRLVSKAFESQSDLTNQSIKFSILVIATFTVLGINSAHAANITQPVNALPTGGVVATGQAAISQTSNQTSAVMNINQSSQKAVINWNSFNVGSNATVNFNQPNTNASTLNRVNGASKSMIDGAVNANGQIILVNPNGVTFGKGAEVNTGGITATTMDIKDSDYMNNNMSYSGNGTGKVINKGKITANNSNAYIALMAPEVINEGVISATLSGNNSIALVSGQSVTLSFNQNQLVNVSVDASVIKSLIANKRLIQTSGGQVIIAANSASDLKTSVINNSGSINADSFANNGGKISLIASTVNQNGNVSANSDFAVAGHIAISGNTVNLASNSKTTAMGATSGGQILIGKTAQNPVNSLINATQVNVATSALVDVSATKVGNGGSIQIWSTSNTNIAGNLKATGGLVSGNGGNIDTSSAGTVNYVKTLKVDTSTTKGKVGNWTTDPLTITVDKNAANVISTALATTNVILDATSNASSSLGACSESGSALINFLAGTQVYSMNPNTTLTLNAQGGSINVAGDITTGGVYAVAQNINVSATGSINTNNGNNGVIFLVANLINILGNINSNGNTNNNPNSINLNASNANTLNNRRSGKSSLSSDNNIYKNNGGVIDIIASSDIYIGANTFISANGLSGGSINIISSAGNVNVNGVIDATGKVNNGGSLIIAGNHQTNLINSLMSADGLSQGGLICIGLINANGSGSILAPPANAPPAVKVFMNTLFSNVRNTAFISSNTFLDNQTIITANAAPSNSQITSQFTNAGQIYIGAYNALSSAASITANADNGGFIIMSSPAGTYQNTGYIQTNGGAGLGGTIVQSGLSYTALIGATTEANGNSGGGNIVIGRDFQASPLQGSASIDATLPVLSNRIFVPTSNITYIDSASTLSANSLNINNGGNILVWGETAVVLGILSTQSFGSTGSGGFIETSGQKLNVLGSVNPGKDGIWLMDPTDITITTGNDTATYSLGQIIGNIDSIVSNINVTTLQNALASGNISISLSSSGSAVGNLTLGADLSVSANTLTINATGGLTGSNNISLATSGSLVINQNGASNYSGSISGSGSVTLGGSGTLTLSGSNNFTGNLSIVGGSLVLGLNGGLGTNNTYSGAISIAQGGNITFANSVSDQTLSGIISGLGSLIVNNSLQTLYLMATNTFKGGTTLISGNLNLNQTNALGDSSGSITVTGGSLNLGSFSQTQNGGVTLTAGEIRNGVLSSSKDFTLQSGTIRAVLSGSGGLNKISSGTVTISSVNAYSGGTKIQLGQIQLSASGSSLGAQQSTITISGGGILDLGGSTQVYKLVLTDGTLQNGTLSASGTIQVSKGVISARLTDVSALTKASLSKSDATTVILSGTNTYSGGTNITGGTLQLGANSYFNCGSGSICSSSNQTYSTGNSPLGRGDVTISAANDGSLHVPGGALDLNGSSNSTNGIMYNKITLSGTGTPQWDQAILMNSSTSATSIVNSAISITKISSSVNSANAIIQATGGNLILGGIISNTGSGTAAGLAINSANYPSYAGTVVFSGSNTYTGSTTLTGGTLSLGSSGALGGGGVIVLGGGNLQFTTSNTTDYSGKFSTASNQQYNIDTNGQNVTFALALTSSGGALTKNGIGNLTLSGANTYTGSTTINGGTLTINSTGTLGNTTSTLNINSATLDLQNRALTLGSLVMTGTSPAITNSIGTSSLLVTGTSTIANSITTSGTQSYTGAVTLGANTSLTTTSNANISLGTITGATYNLSNSSGSGNQSYAGGSGIGTLSITTTGLASQSGAIGATNALFIGSGTFTFNTSANSIGTIATASLVGSIAVLNSGAVTVGSITNGGSTYSGLSSSGTISISTNSGDITVANNITTTNNSNSAVVINAGLLSNAGTITGGNIIWSGGATPTLIVGTGGRATLYTGSISSSMGVTNLAGAGSGNFRYNSTATITNYTLALGTGIYVVYREQPTLTITANNPSDIIYGSTQPTYTTTIAGVNGDTAIQALSTQAIVTAGGNISNSGYLTADTHTLTPSAAVDQLGYLINSSSYLNGSIAITARPITLTANSNQSKIYGNLDPTLTYSVQTNTTNAGLVGTDSFSGALVRAAGETVVGGPYAISQGTVANSNYTINYVGANFAISPLPLIVTIGSGSNIYGSPVSTGIVNLINILKGDIVTTSSVSIVNPTYSSSGNLNVNGYQQSISSVLGGRDAANYILVSGFTTVAKNYTVTPLALNANIADSNNLYGSAVTPGLVSFSNKLNGDLVTSSIVTIVNPLFSNTGNLVAGTYAQRITNILGGYDAGNYTLTNGFTTGLNNYTVNQLNTIVFAGSYIQQSITTSNYVQSPTSVNASGNLLFNFTSAPVASLITSPATVIVEPIPTATSTATPTATTNSDSGSVTPNATTKINSPSIEPSSPTSAE